MKTTTASTVTLLLLASSTALAADAFDIRNEAEFRKCVPADAKLENLAGDMGFLEGPQWVPTDGGYLVFSDIPNNELKKWTTAGGLTTFRKPSGNANGNTLDNEGRLVTAGHGSRNITRTERDGAVKVLVDSYDGKKLNSPNDVVVKKDGTIWFTDPDYGLPNKPGAKEKDGKEQAGNFVFRFDPKSGKTTLVAKGFVNPNGLAFSPDERFLYVADSAAPAPRPIRRFEVNSDGALAGGDVFCTIDKGGPDGIRCDAAGRVWSSAGDGVQIFTPDGSLIGKILVPEAPANLCFGSKELKTLYLTARKSLYKIEVAAKGIR